MADKDNPNFNDDDFLFDEFDHDDASHQARPQSEAMGQSSISSTTPQFLSKRNPRKLIISGVIIAIIIIFLVYHFSTRSFNPLTDLKHASTESTATTPATPTPAPTTAAPTPAPAPQPSQMDQLTDQVNTLGQTINQQKETITELQGNISTLQDSVNNLNTTLGNMSQQLTTLTDRIPKPAPKKVKPQEVGPPPVNYIVKALVPGRAWLQGSNGSTLSVVAGNTVPEHGTVTSVDVNSGQVTTSDGSVFTYDINGN